MHGITTKYIIFCLILIYPLFRTTPSQAQNLEIGFTGNPAREIANLQQKLQGDPGNIVNLKSLIRLYSYLADNEKILEIANKLVESGDEQNDINAYMYGLVSKAIAFQGLGQVDSMFHYYGRGLDLGKEHEDSAILLMVYNGLGVYSLQIETDYYKALSYFLEGIKYREDDSDPRIYSLLYNIAATYYVRSDPTGLKYALEVYELGHKHNNNYMIFVGSNVTAGMYYIMEDYENALKYIRETVKYVDMYGEHTGVYNLYGNILLKMDREEEAVSYYHEALKHTETGRPAFVIEANLHYAQYLIGKARYYEAIYYLNRGIAVSRESNNTVNLYLLYKYLSLCYEKTGNVDQALNYYKDYHFQTDSIFNYNKERTIDELRMQYETEKKERQIQEGKVELMKASRRNQIFFFIIVFIIICILVAFILYRKQNKMYKQIARQHHDLIKKGRVYEEAVNYDLSNTSMDKYSVSSLSGEKGKQMFDQLENAMKEDCLYRDKDLTIEKLADRLGTNRTYLSQIINEYTGSSYNHYINSYRINEAVRILSDVHSDIQLKVLAYDLGFNYRETFYKSFQKAIGMSPSKYREEIRKMYRRP